ncbi:MAG: SDR family NAD(P)-dependent oxidoreductase [Gammaproteobacteria bacterium]|nr:SDR family NAD(P)-dependent oxidoreductase [Gammaproteobacteria bacterium]
MANKIALITGATSGIGAAFAKKFASQNYDLIITGRREEKIKQLAAELMALYKVNVEVMLIELAKKDDLELLLQKVAATKNLDILINNAGFGLLKKFIDVDPPLYTEMFAVHDYAPIRLMQVALKNMLAKNKGAIINVSSFVGFFPAPDRASYAASKAYLSSITESIAEEIKDSQVRIQVLCPGMTRTEISERKGASLDEFVKKYYGRLITVMTAESVVESSLQALARKKLVCIPGVRNKALVWVRTLKRLISL